jgi:hypothetical protein
MKTLLTILCAAAALTLPARTESTAGLLTPASTAALRKVIQPDGSEQRWLEIAWETDLDAARKRAASEDKPVFLWEMDGHPLGCT